MKSDKIGFEIDHMDFKTNLDVIEHIYSESHRDDKKLYFGHPLDMICDSMSHTFHIGVDTVIDASKHKAYVSLTFDSSFEKTKIKQLSNRFQSTTENLLGAKIKRIYE